MAKWQTREQVSDDIETQLLASRGIDDKDKFFSPDYEKDLRDPFGLLGMDKAVDRILSAIKKREKIAVFGDYDADGVCASAIFHDFFKKIGFENFAVHIPDRNIEGYGLNFEAIEQFEKEQVDLIITVDCGIADYDEIRKANENGIDTVVLDHHLQPEKIPQAIAIVDPKQEKDDYPFEMLAGAGVAFKTIQALVDKGGFAVTPGWEKWLLDLVAIATVADMMPLEDENRVLVFYGLQVLKKTRRPGLLKLFEKTKIQQQYITEDDIAFLIAPRINIAGRMDHANASYALLTTESVSEAEWIAEHLDSLNVERKETVAKILDEIDKRAKDYKKKPEIIVEGDLSWPVGVLGLTANKVMEKYECPVFLWGAAAAEKIKGSCRSNGMINLVDLMRQLPDGFLKEFGGHAAAAGFSLERDKIGDFKEEVVKLFGKIDKKETEALLWIDKEIKLEKIDWDFLQTVEKFRPFGMGNSRPYFLFKNLEVSRVNKFGNGGIHLRLDFSTRDGLISAIGFFMSNGHWDIKSGDKIDLAASIERNYFNGYDELRLRIIDIRNLPACR